ncbi:hypothetical protein Acr_23g0010730 [Actinidia rufa]|uniref:Uncharacterized protein n=1 Tax=Actinidia rufa TaxID=165716 RepID=A0A7J0GPL3_9ERIC|nr:hypothetical protein Acr_23g0010730 [Actinidia rufa]
MHHREVASLACLFWDDVEHPLDPNPPWIVWISHVVGLLSAYPLLELIILVLIPLEGIGLDLSQPFHKVFILDLYEHLGYRGVKRRQHQMRGILMLDPVAHERQVFKLSPNLFGDLAGPFKVYEKALHINLSEYSWIIIKFLYESKWSMGSIFPSYTPRWDGNLNLDETLTFITIFMNEGSICLIKVSIVTGAFVPVVMASIRASRSLIFWVGIYLIHDPDLLDDFMHLTMNTF